MTAAAEKNQLMKSSALWVKIEKMGAIMSHWHKEDEAGRFHFIYEVCPKSRHIHWKIKLLFRILKENPHAWIRGKSAFGFMKEKQLLCFLFFLFNTHALFGSIVQ